MNQKESLFILDNKKMFSLLELMTVILVILLLISLLIPIFVNVKMNARNALCKNQLRQIGTLFVSYAYDNGGYLPNDKSLDLGGTPGSHDLQTAVRNASGNTLLYEGWNGHLLPYIETFGKDYTKRARLFAGGIIKSHGTTASGLSTSWYLEEKIVAGWNGWNWGKSKELIIDSIEKGGHHDLKVFICPEIHANTYDIDYAIANNNIKIPKITQIGDGGTYTDPKLPTGVPTTYLANSTFFGCDNLSDERDLTTDLRKSLRMDEISTISKKAMILEGGRVVQPWSCIQSPYYGLVDLSYWGIETHRMSYSHDDFKTFWIIKVTHYHFFIGNPDMENAFNLNFKGQAEIILGSSTSLQGYVIISLIDPVNKPFDKFLEKYGVISSKIVPYKTYDFSEYHYMIGNMNVLFGDGAVQSSSPSWLSQNRSMVSVLTTE